MLAGGRAMTAPCGQACTALIDPQGSIVRHAASGTGTDLSDAAGQCLVHVMVGVDQAGNDHLVRQAHDPGGLQPELGGAVGLRPHPLDEVAPHNNAGTPDVPDGFIQGP